MKARNQPKSFKKHFWLFNNSLLPENVTNFLGFFQKVPLTMLLGTFLYSKMANFSHKNFTSSSSNNPNCIC
jgi:hypothetical protein